MANIPVEKNNAGGLPWWAWLLGLLALLLLATLLLRGCDDDEATTDDTAVVDDGVSTAGDFDESLADDDTAVTDGSTDAAGATATGGAITTLADLNRELGNTSAAAGSLNGRAVTLTDEAVTAVVGDSTFYVGSGAERVLVVLQELGEEAQGAGGSDGVYNVDTGDRVTVRGRVTTYDASTIRGLGALTDADRSEAERRGYVVVTDQGGLAAGADATQ